MLTSIFSHVPVPPSIFFLFLDRFVGLNLVVDRTRHFVAQNPFSIQSVQEGATECLLQCVSVYSMSLCYWMLIVVNASERAIDRAKCVWLLCDVRCVMRGVVVCIAMCVRDWVYSFATRIARISSFSKMRD